MKNFAKFAGINLLGLLTPALASASLVGGTGQTITAPPPVAVTVGGAIGLLCAVINIMFTLLIILAVIFVLWAAWTYLRAGGDPGKVSEAGNRLLYAAVAVGVAILARSIPIIVGSLFQVTALNACN